MDEEMSENTINRVADSVTMQLMARGGVIFLTLVALPFGIWAGSRLIDTVDKLADDVGVLKTEMAVIRRDVVDIGDDVDELKETHLPGSPFGGPRR